MSNKSISAESWRYVGLLYRSDFNSTLLAVSANSSVVLALLELLGLVRSFCGLTLFDACMSKMVVTWALSSLMINLLVFLAKSKSLHPTSADYDYLKRKILKQHGLRDFRTGHVIQKSVSPALLLVGVMIVMAAFIMALDEIVIVPLFFGRELSEIRLSTYYGTFLVSFMPIYIWIIARVWMARNIHQQKA